MTKKELKEAIAATITENGQKGITGQALANLLNEIVDAAGEGGGGGASNVLYLDAAGYNGPNKHNAQIFKTIWEGSANGVCYQICFVSSGDGSCMGVTSTGYLGMDELGIMISFVLYQDPEPMWMAIVLSEDGSIIDSSQGIV